MSLVRRGNVWHYNVTINGRKHRGSCKTEDKQQAQEFHDKLRASLWRSTVVKEKPRRTWAETLDRWLGAHEHKRSIACDSAHGRFWTDEFRRVGVKYLDEITPDFIGEIRDREVGRAKQRSKNTAGVVKPATVNRKLALLRAVMNAAHSKYLWLDVKPTFEFLQERNAKVRWLEPAEFSRLVAALPPTLAALARFSVATGVRQSNAFNLKWSQVNFARRSITLEQEVMKNGEPFSAPLNRTAMEVIRSQVGQSDTYVFPKEDGLPFKQLSSKLWSESLERAGIENFRWHDIRHTWASWLRQAGVGLDKLQELGGWQDSTMVQRYAHLSIEHLADSASAIDDVISGAPGIRAQIGHSGGQGARAKVA
jgi:integrase